MSILANLVERDVWVPSGSARALLGHAQPALEAKKVRALEAVDLSSLDYFAAAQLLMLAGDLGEVDRLALEALLLQLRVALGRGSTRLSLGSKDVGTMLRVLSVDEVVIDEALKHIATLATFDAAILETHAYATLMGVPGARKPLILDGDYLSIERYDAAERLLAKLVVDTCVSTSASIAADDLKALMQKCGFVLSDEQQCALNLALTHPLTLVTGGPGTGKTSITLALVTALTKGAGVSANKIALCAPTGKAAYRIREVLTRALNDVGDANARAFDVQTLHRLLAYSPSRGTFGFHANNRLPYRWIVVDEASMIDTELMLALFLARAPDAHVVLMGDAGQLSALSPGDVFADLCRSDFAAKQVLTKNFRMSASHDAQSLARLVDTLAIGRADGAIEGADASRLSLAPFASRPRVNDPSGDAGLHWAGELSEASLALFLRDWFDAFIDPLLGRALANMSDGLLAGPTVVVLNEAHREHFALLARAQLLCVTRQRVTGTERINRWFVRHARTRVAQEQIDRTTGYLLGMPILVTENDYALDVYNGDVGILTGGETPGAVFMRGEQGFWVPFSRIARKIEPAFAMTVHKSQGSEYDHVGLILPESDTPLMTRDLLYTALTRARRSVRVVGADRVWLEGAVRARARETGFMDALRVAAQRS